MKRRKGKSRIIATKSISKQTKEKYKTRNYDRWTPETVKMRFPTEVDMLFGSLDSNYSLLNDSQRQIAERWKNNYIKSFDIMMQTLSESIDDPEILDELDNLRWNIMQSGVEKFLEGQDKYPQELSIRVNYSINDLYLNAERIMHRWGEIYA